MCDSRHQSFTGVVFLALYTFFLTSCGAGRHVTPSQRDEALHSEPSDARKEVPLDPFVQNQALGRGVNFGNLLEATPHEGAWTDGRLIEPTDFDLARSAGFDSVRLPIRFSEHASPNPPYTIDVDFMQRVDEVVRMGLDCGLRVVIDVHHYEELQTHPQEHRARLVALWEQIATHFVSFPDTLYYDFVNEPNQKLTPSLWNEVLAETLRAVRRIDRRHTVVIGCAMWGNPSAIHELKIPDEETNAIASFHYYTPPLFCFQGKEWAGRDFATTGITWPGPPETPVTPSEGVSSWVTDWFEKYNGMDAHQNPGGEAFIQAEILALAEWGKRHHRPLWMGEFTAQDGADLASRVRWITFVRTELEKHGIPWSFWSLLSDSGSRLYNEATGKWATELTRALGLEVGN